MLDEFILDHLSKLEKERETLTEQLQKLVQEEETENKKIQELIDQEDVGIELFSPRSAQNSIKTQVGFFQKHIDEIQYEEARIQDLLEQNKANDEKYQLLLLESREKTTGDISDTEKNNNSESNASSGMSSSSIMRSSQNNSVQSDEYKEELETILIRVEKCLNLIHSDRVKCKNELKNLRYYLKALLSK